MTGDTVYIQLVSNVRRWIPVTVVEILLVPNIRRWIPVTVVEILSARSYKVKTIKGGIYIRNRTFIRIKHTDSRQSLKTTPKDTVPCEGTTHTDRPNRITRRPQRLIESMDFIWTRYYCVSCKLNCNHCRYRHNQNSNCL